MKPTQARDGYAHFDDGTGWPLPGDYYGAIDWRLRYGDPTRSDLLMVASLINAYHTLVMASQRRRNEVVAAIREAMQIAAADKERGR